MTKVIIPGQNVPISIGGTSMDPTWYEKLKLLESVLTSGGYGLNTGTGSSASISLTAITASLGADVNLNNTGNYFDGPGIAQGTTGTWFVSGTVTLTSTTGDNHLAKLWDGTNVIASAATTNLANFFTTISLSGYLASPIGNLRISVRDLSTANGKIIFSASGNGKDSTITAIRIA